MDCSQVPRAQGRDAGFALLVVLAILLVVAGASISFIWFMNREQAHAGRRYRSAAALAVAEAGIHRALSILESAAPDGSPGRAWRPDAYTEEATAGPLGGRFVLSITDGPGGAILVTSSGEVAGVTRRLRARVHLASPALLAALHGVGIVRLENPPAATVVLPYGTGIGDRPWIHIASSLGIWLATSDVSINAPAVLQGLWPGPIDEPAGAGSAADRQLPGPVRLLLARGATLMLGETRQPVRLHELRAAGVHVEGAVLWSEALPPFPEVDRAHFEALAAANVANAGLNEAAGRHAGDRDLAGKRDSLYSEAQFRQLLAFTRTGQQPAQLSGVVYVAGGVELMEGQHLLIMEGALVAESTVHLIEGATLEVRHSAATRTLPGVIVLGNGALAVTQKARLLAHGLVYTSRAIEVGEGARVDVVGAVLGGDRAHSFRNLASTVVIRYDPAVLGTPGLKVPDGSPAVVWVAAWEELP